MNSKMGIRSNLVGQKFWHLTVVEMLFNFGRGKKKGTYCRCICDCGNEHIIAMDKLKRRPHLSCGCMTKYYRSLVNRTDETGEKFGRLTILSIDYEVGKKTTCLCKCDCGKTVRLAKVDVVSGHTKSCGCLHKEVMSLSNTKDFTGMVNNNGVELIERTKQNSHGVWLWKFKCPICGNYFEALPARVFNGDGTFSCGCLRQSKREALIENELKQNGVKYETQKRFPDCKDTNTLPFDFAIYDNNDKLFCLLEYDGEQHFKPNDFFGGEEEFINRVKRDNIKNEYCKNNNIKLYRLNYKNTREEIIKFIQTLFIRNDCDTFNGNIVS